MPVRPHRFDAEAVRKLWDTAAGAYAEGQASGRDYYRLEFFGPAHIALCGDVQGLRILDVGCGTGYFAREMARRGASVTGVDISPRMLAHAAQAESQDPLGIRYLVHQQFSFWRSTGIDLRLELKSLNHELHQVLPTIKDHITG